MGCLKLINYEYEGKNIKMSKKKNSKDSTQTIGMTKQSENYVVPQSTITLLKWMVGFCGAIFTACLGIVGWIAVQTYDLNKNSLTKDSTVISSIQDDIKSINDNIDNNICNNINTIKENLEGKDGVYSRLSSIETIINISVIKASLDTQEYIKDVSIKDNNISNVTNSFSENTCIGTDSNGKTYIAKELIGHIILLTYKQDNKEIYFLGKYNDKYHWNGYCVTNTYYLDGTLYGICESNFDDGKRLDYKSFCVSKNDSKEWIYSNKICNTEGNSGVNIRYSLDYDREKNFTNTNVRVTDILYVDSFLENVKPEIRAYYFGNTVDGKFNDDTGNAYEVIYDDEGKIKTLYVGQFKNGTFNDNTGNAWDIAYSDKGGYYVCNTGKFKDGHALDKSHTPLSQSDIDEIISGYDFKAELKWK